MSALLALWLLIAVPHAVGWGGVWYRYGSSDGWIAPGNLRASVVDGIIFGVCWPVMDPVFLVVIVIRQVVDR